MYPIETKIVRTASLNHTSMSAGIEGIIFTASLMIGVASTTASSGQILLSGLVGLFARSISMAASFESFDHRSGDEHGSPAFKSVDLVVPCGNGTTECAAIYVSLGVDGDLARQVATQLSARSATLSHRPKRPRFSSILPASLNAMMFAAGATVPIHLTLLTSPPCSPATIAAFSLAFAILLGALDAMVGGARIFAATLRIASWGTLAMALTACAGRMIASLI